MFKSASRGQRSKGVKVKHILQICLLIGVCFWLIYQVKHSHNKREELYKGDAKISIKEQDDSIKKAGRRYLHPHVQQVINQKPNEEEEEDAMDDEEENNHSRAENELEKNKHLAEEREVEENVHQEEEHKYEEHEENKHEEEQDEKENTRDEGRSDGGDELHEHDPEREGEIDGEEDFLIEEKEKEENDEIDGKENEEKEREEDENGEIDGKENKEKEREGDDNDESDGNDNDEREGNFDNESSESQDHGDDINNNHEAREEHYKGDDASSEVDHDSQTESHNGEKSTTNNLIENRETTTSEEHDKSNNHAVSIPHDNSGVKLGEVAVTGNEKNSSNVVSKEGTNEVGSSISVNSSLANSTNTTQLIDLPGARNASEQVSAGVSFNSSDATTIYSQLNETEALSGVSLAQEVNRDGAMSEEKSKLLPTEPELSNSDSLTLNSNEYISNTTMVTKTKNTESLEPYSSVNTTESTASEKIMSPDTTVKVVESSNSTAMKENADALPKKEYNSTEEFVQKIKSKDSTSTQSLDDVKDDAIDSSDSSTSQDEKEVHLDLDTLPVAESNKIDDVLAE